MYFLCMANKKKSQRTEMTMKERRFADKYLECGNKTEAADQVYNCKDRAVAQVVGHNVSMRPQVLVYLKEQEDLAKQTIIDLCANGESEFIRSNAAKDILDRNTGKAVQKKTDGESKGDTYNILIQRYDKREELGKAKADNDGDSG